MYLYTIHLSMRSLILCLLLLSVSQASNCPSFGCSDNALLRRLETESVCNQKFALLEEGFDRAINSQNPNSTDFLEAVTTLYRDVLAPDFSAFIWPTPQTTPRYLSGRDQIIGFTVVLTQIFRYRRAIPEYIVYESYTDNGLRSAETFVRITQHFRNNTGNYLIT